MCPQATHEEPVLVIPQTHPGLQDSVLQPAKPPQLPQCITLHASLLGTNRPLCLECPLVASGRMTLSSSEPKQLELSLIKDGDKNTRMT
jgi:hypothetical protein